MITPSIYDIKYDTMGKSPYFFSGKTLKFFGQTMKSFRVRKSPSGRIFICAIMCGWDRKPCGYTFREYADHDLKDVRNDDGSLAAHDTIYEINSYINTH